MELKPHQERVVTEKRELDGKISKLELFLAGDLFMTLPSDERSRLRAQLGVMQRYSDILGNRIEAFE